MTQLPYIVFRQTPPKAVMKTKELFSIKINDTQIVGYHIQIRRITQPDNREITETSRI